MARKKIKPFSRIEMKILIYNKMKKGLSYEEALKQAQELGYAEADPTADVEGYDALGKIVILANTVMGANLRKDEPPCEGITKITAEDIKKANLGNITIADLKELHRKKLEATKQEQLEEQRRIEERQKLIEARKEELRLRREKESKESVSYTHLTLPTN